MKDLKTEIRVYPTDELYKLEARVVMLQKSGSQTDYSELSITGEPGTRWLQALKVPEGFHL